LYQAMDRLRMRFGEDKVQRAVGMQFRQNKMNPFNGQSS